jgi:hypothetical protein
VFRLSRIDSTEDLLASDTPCFLTSSDIVNRHSKVCFTTIKKSNVVQLCSRDCKAPKQDHCGQSQNEVGVPASASCKLFT